MRVPWFVLLAAACTQAPQAVPTQRVVPQADSPTVWLAAHNRERAAFGSAPLSWEPALAAQARSYARELAAIGRLKHSAKAERPGQGENLWLGSRGHFAPEQMVANWASEKRYFRRGVFPANSTTGNWRDIGHYSQIVWPRTTRVGCGLASSARWDVLVCRYSPPGNQDGLRI